MTARLILASSSPRRRELLGGLGLAFTIIKPEIDESLRPGENPLNYVERLSRQKAEAVLKSLDAAPPPVILAADTIVLAADTIGVAEGGDLLGKPADADEARVMLHRLSDRTHLVCTAVHLIAARPEALRRVASRAHTRVTMRPYTDDEIEAYIATGDPFDKAGSYAIQHPVFRPVARIDGCYTNVVGLPVCEVRWALAALGLPVTVPESCDCAPYQAPA